MDSRLATALIQTKRLLDDDDWYERPQFLEDFEKHMLQSPNGSWKAGSDCESQSESDLKLIRKCAKKFFEQQVEWNPISGKRDSKRAKAATTTEMERIETGFCGFWIAQIVFPSGKPTTWSKGAPVRFFTALGIWESRAVISVLNFFRGRMKSFDSYDENSYDEKFEEITSSGWPNSAFGNNIINYQKKSGHMQAAVPGAKRLDVFTI